MVKRRKPTHPGEILDELYIKPLKLNLQKLADRLAIARNALFKIRAGEASVTPSIALLDFEFGTRSAYASYCSLFSSVQYILNSAI